MDHRHSRTACMPQEKWVKLKEGVRRNHQDHSFPCPLPTVCKALQKSSQPLDMLLYYSINTIGWEGQEAPGSTNSQGDTGSKGNTGGSSHITSLSVLNVLSFP